MTTFVAPSGCTIELPEHWTAESIDGDWTLITRRNVAQGEAQGLVSVDERKRGFALGYTVHIPRDATYKGRGWQARLFADAIAALQASWR